MSWSSIGNNQTITFNNLIDGVNSGALVAKTSIPSSQECITKSQANEYINLDVNYTPYANKTLNQLVVKGDLVIYSQRIWGIDANSESWGLGGGLVTYSNNGGLNWTLLSLEGGFNPAAKSICRNSTGQYVLYGIEDFVAVSNNFGTNFLSQDLPGSVYSLSGTAISNSGQNMYAIGVKLVATSSDNSPAPAICKSTDYGASWSLAYTYPRVASQYTESFPQNKIATSGNGQYVLAIWGGWNKFSFNWGSAIMRSTNYGVSFSNGEYSDIYLTDVAVSNTGQYQLMTRMSSYGTGNIKGKGGLYWSNNYGAGFASKIYEENYRALYCAMSASGQRMLVAYINTTDSVNKFYFSRDFGVTWASFNTNPTPPLRGPMPGGVYVAPDGNYAVIVYVDSPQITYTVDFENWITIPVSEFYKFVLLNKSR